MGCTTATKRILIIGEAPSGRLNGGLTRRRLSELADRPWEDWADWINLLDEWPGRGRGKGSDWNPRAAREAAEKLLAERVADYDTVVLLGRRVAQVMIPAGSGFPFFRFLDRAGTRMAVIPHTSGIVRFWNDPENVAKARRFLSSIIDTKEADMAETARSSSKKKTTSAKKKSSTAAAKKTTSAKRTPAGAMATTEAKGSSEYVSDREALAAAFRAAGVPLTATEAASYVIEAGVVRPATAGTPVDYRLYAPIYRQAKKGLYYDRVGDEKPARFVLRDDVPLSSAGLVEKLAKAIRKVTEGREAALATAAGDTDPS